MKSLLKAALLLSVLLIQACGSHDSDMTTQANHSTAKQSNGTDFTGTFIVQIGQLGSFTQLSKRSKSLNYRNDLWEFKGDGKMLRMAGRFEHDETQSELASKELEYNNVYLEFMYMINGKNTRVSCKANRKPQGSIVRTIHADNSSSGHFELVFELCRNIYTETEINEITTPLLVAGQFEKLKVSDSLF